MWWTWPSSAMSMSFISRVSLLNYNAQWGNQPGKYICGSQINNLDCWQPTELIHITHHSRIPGIHISNNTATSEKMRGVRLLIWLACLISRCPKSPYNPDQTVSSQLFSLLEYSNNILEVKNQMNSVLTMQPGYPTVAYTFHERSAYPKHSKV